ncbi:MAG TPA: NifU family protein [Acidimicrobiia bacterium]|nr:NifU family protein [Acidimicrobiia bacterium]
MAESFITISPEALEMIRQLRDQEPGDGEIGLLLEITGVRHGQFAYDLAFIPVEEAEGDHLIERHGDLAVIIPERDTTNLAGASLSLNDEGLAMDNPNRPAAPQSPAMAVPQGDLEGPLADQIIQVLEESINPAIAAHGGRAELVSVDGSIAYLKLAGGCQGCGMAQVTLKQGIERILMDAIPAVTEVVDVTDHAAGSDPYYQRSKK